jgi:AcrR family transcriptional regulator
MVSPRSSPNADQILKGYRPSVARTPAQPTSTARSRRRRADLLAAARQVFEERGYVNTSVSDVVQRAGGSRASFYSYFTSKDDVLRVLVGELTDDLFAAAAPQPGLGATTFENLVASIRQFLQVYRERAPLLLVLDQATTVNPEFLQVRLAIRSRFVAPLESTLAQRSDRRPDPDGLAPRLTAMALGGMVEDLARGRYLFGQEFDDDAAVRTLAVLWARSLGVRTRGAGKSRG